MVPLQNTGIRFTPSVPNGSGTVYSGSQIRKKESKRKEYTDQKKEKFRTGTPKKKNGVGSK
jgi:hypothetical protein